MYIIYFLPAIVSIMVFIFSLRLGVNKNALTIAFVSLMITFLFVKEKVILVTAINAMAIVFTLFYLMTALFFSIKEKQEEKEGEE